MRPFLAAWSLAVVAALALAGCGGSSGSSGGGGSGDPPTEGGKGSDGGSRPALDGEAAHGFVARLLEDSRVPGTAGHAATKQRIWELLDVEGWDRQRHDVTGLQFLEADHGPVEAYLREPWCTDEKRERAQGLAFTNFAATFDTPSNRTWWLGAHWDAKRTANLDPDEAKRDEEVPGANDGASGVGVLLQLMREIAAGKAEPVADVGVVLFDGEDGFEDCHPLAGSILFVQDMDETTREAADRLLLLDMVGDPDARFVRDTYSRGCAEPWQDAIWAKAPAHGLGANFLNVSRTVADDHVPFANAGIPAVDLIDLGRDTGFPPYWHTTEDTLDKVDAAMLGRVGSLVMDLLDEEVPLGECA